MSQPPILIIGAGIGGLSLAIGLQNLGIPFHVFERDASLVARSQGYHVHLDPQGTEALKDILTAEQWELFGRTCPTVDEGFTCLDAVKGEELDPRAPLQGHDGRGPPGNFYTVDRTTLRKVLAAELDPATLSFSKDLLKFETIEEVVRAHFIDGSTFAGSLLVGADGGNSSVRRLYLPDLKPLDAEGWFIYGKTPLTDEYKKACSPEVLKGVIYDKTQPPGITLLLERIYFSKDANLKERYDLPDDYAYWMIVAHRDLFLRQGMTNGRFPRYHGETAAALTREITAHWDPSLKAVFEHQDPTHTGTTSVVTMRPDLPSWTPTRVTLIGDAAHISAPLGSTAVTSALEDAASLCRVIAKAGVTVDSVGAYEEVMRLRMRTSIELCLQDARSLYAMKELDELMLVGFPLTP